MKFRHLGSLSALFCLALLGSHVQASLPAEDYWQSLWPNTPMPKALRDLTQPDSEGKDGSSRARGVTQPKPGDDNMKYKVAYGRPPSDSNMKYKVAYGRAPPSDSNMKYKVAYGRPPSDSNMKYKVAYGRPPSSINIKYKVAYGKPPIGANIKYKVAYGKPPSKGSVPTELEDTLNATFFLAGDLHPGKKMNLEFTKRSDDTFLPDRVAKSIPFSTTKFPEILNRFNIEAGSAEAETMRSTLEICEQPSMKGEDKYCATSLESLVNFSVSKLGKNIRLLSTVLEKETPKQQQYSVMEGVQKDGEKAVVCHKMDYPYTVFYCHKIATWAYTVPLVAADGKKVKALAVCHTDTQQWSPEHIAFQQLHVKPGTVPICHFLATDTLLWVPN